jgi:hypothetical protein
LFQNLANPSIEVMRDVLIEELERFVGLDDKSSLVSWWESNHLQDDLPMSFASDLTNAW